MDIENLGESLIEQLVDKKLVKNFADLYKLDVNTLANLERMADKSAWNIIDGIEKSKTRPLWRLIAALGILNVGTETAQIVADKFTSLDKIRNATLKELIQNLSEFKEPALPKIIYEHMSSPINKKTIQAAIDINKNEPLWMFIKDLHIKNIAEKKSQKLAKHFNSIDDFLNTTADIEKIRERLQKKPVIPKSIYDYFHNKQNLDVIDKLLAAGVSPSSPQEKSSAILANKTFVITGSLESLTRSQAEQLIKDNGGKVSSSVSQNTSFLIAGKDAGSKLDKAQELNIKIINEDEFLKLIDKNKQPKKERTLWD
jgi:DNA ligase (NAD+)